ncbi:MAG: hypothetical protein ACP5JW_01830 [Candidatus Bathyarchaeia archaeon]
MVDELKLQKISDYAKILVGIFLEALSNLLAMVNLKRIESYLVWKRSAAQKSLPFRHSFN